MHFKVESRLLPTEWQHFWNHPQGRQLHVFQESDGALLTCDLIARSHDGASQC